MADLIEQRDGEASFVEVGPMRSAWHRLGKWIDSATRKLTIPEALEEARLKYPVAKRAVLLTRNTPDGDSYQIPSTMTFETFREDTGTQLGTVGKDYHVVQNEDAFRLFEPLVDSGLASVETAGVLREGADAWIMLNWDLSKFGSLTQKLFLSDKLGKGGLKARALLVMNHAGKRSILGRDIAERVVCANTLDVALGEDGDEFRVEHHKGALTELTEKALAYWHDKIEAYEVAAQQYQILKQTFLTQEEFADAVLAVIAPDPRLNPKWNPEARMADAVVGRYEAKVKTITNLWEHGADHDGDHSAWEAYNGTVQALDHDVDGLWPSRAGVVRTASLLDGSLRQMKRKVLSNLVTVSVR